MNKDPSSTKMLTEQDTMGPHQILRVFIKGELKEQNFKGCFVKKMEDTYESV